MQSILASISFGVSITVLITLLPQCLLRTNRYIGLLVNAAFFQSIGAFAAFWSDPSSDHGSFLLNMINTSVAPIFLLSTLFEMYDSLQQHISASTGRRANAPIYSVVAMIAPALSAVTMAVSGYYFYQFLKPVDAVYGLEHMRMRLHCFERGVAVMRLGYAIQLASTVYLGLPLMKNIVFDREYMAIASAKTSERFVSSIRGVFFVSFFWMLQRLVAYNDISTYRLGFAGSEWFTWVRDSMPILVCLVMLCWSPSGPYLSETHGGTTPRPECHVDADEKETNYETMV